MEIWHRIHPFRGVLRPFRIAKGYLWRVNSRIYARISQNRKFGIAPRVNFIQIGVNDGLRNDPVREFIIRDGWRGVLVEPVPFVFESLRHNYQYLNRKDLIFVNAAITSTCDEHFLFWTFKGVFLETLPLDEQYMYLRKSSFDKSHLIRLLKTQGISDSYSEVLSEIKVPTLTLRCLVERYWPTEKIHILIIDAEGHEASIIPSIDLEILEPEAIFFEWSNLGEKKDDVMAFLSDHGYEIIELKADAIALRTSM